MSYVAGGCHLIATKHDRHGRYGLFLGAKCCGVSSAECFVDV